MAFYLKNLHKTFVMVTVGQDKLTILPGKITGPFDDEDMTQDVISKANRRIINVFVPEETTEDKRQIEPEPNKEPENIEDVETEEL